MSHIYKINQDSVYPKCIYEITAMMFISLEIFRLCSAYLIESRRTLMFACELHDQREWEEDGCYFEAKLGGVCD